MIIKKFEDDEEWLEARRTKITGTRLKDIVVLRGTNEKEEFYNLIAERLAKPREKGIKPMDRGHLLEVDAINKCEEELGKTFNKDLVMWSREDNECISISPDGYLDNLTEACEVKCLGSGKQLKAIILNEIPDDFKFQCLQYFIVNDLLTTLHFVMYDPDLPDNLSYKRFEIKRTDIQEDIEKYLEYQRKKLEEINQIVIKLSY